MTEEEINDFRTRNAADQAGRAAALKKIGVQIPEQLTSDDLNHLTPEQIAQANENGQLDRLLGRL